MSDWFICSASKASVDSSCVASDTPAGCSKDGAGVEIYDIEVLVQL